MLVSIRCVSRVPSKWGGHFPSNQTQTLRACLCERTKARGQRCRTWPATRLMGSVDDPLEIYC